MPSRILKIKLSEDEVKALQEMADEAGMSKAAIMRQALWLYKGHCTAAKMQRDMNVLDMLPHEFRALSPGELG